MTLSLNKSTLYFKRFFSSTIVDPGLFKNLCQAIEAFPIEGVCPEIKGLYLEGDHFFKKILLSESGTLGPEETRQIQRITPIIDQGRLPFVFEQNYFEIRLPVGYKTFDELIRLISTIGNTLDGLAADSAGKKIEIHLRGDTSADLLKCISMKVIPNLPEGTYRYESLVTGQDVETGVIPHPIEFSRLPEPVSKLIFFSKKRYLLKLTDNRNTLILERSKPKEISLSFYSGDVVWFRNALKTCEKAGLFKDYRLPGRYKNLSGLAFSA